MSRKIILQIMKSILLIMKIILRIVGLETGYAERIRKCQEKVHVYERLAAARRRLNYFHRARYALISP